MTDNFTKVPNAILEALIRHRLTGAQYTILLYVIRKTRGWGKTSDKISVSMIARESGYSRREIINSVRDLEKKKVIDDVKTEVTSAVAKYVRNVTMKDVEVYRDNENGLFLMLYYCQ